MRLAAISIVALAFMCAAATITPTPVGIITGTVTYKGNPPKTKLVDTSKEPTCAKLRAGPLMTEDVVTGPANALKNVVVYVLSGPTVNSPVPSTPVTFDQQGCQYTTHVLAFRTGQDVKISNSDPFSHNIHPLAKINREWNRIQLPGTPPFSYSYSEEEFIHIKCNIHAWMQGYFVVLRTSHFAVTGEDGQFSLRDFSPGRYTVTAWHETFGTLNQEITFTGSETQTLNFVFQLKP
jgi:plastocyanin